MAIAEGCATRAPNAVDPIPDRKNGLQGEIMLAYFVHDEKKQKDRIVIPDMHCAVRVDVERFEAFISSRPNFAEWSGEACELPPEDFGKVVASRDEFGDVCVLDEDAWRGRVDCYSGGGRQC
jgi:hypothetical protein